MSDTAVRNSTAHSGDGGAARDRSAQGGPAQRDPRKTAAPDDFAVQIADQIESFIVAVREVAKGDEPDSAVPFLLLELSQLMLAGGRLGAHEDIVPDERYEPDAGPEPDAERLREQLAVLLEPVDVYSEVFDPYVPRSTPVACRISEALWWWQFSYLSNWGPTASASLRALQSLVAHVRLDSPLDELDGLDTDVQPDADEVLAEQAGRVMAAEIAAPLGLRPKRRIEPRAGGAERAGLSAGPRA